MISFEYGTLIFGDKTEQIKNFKVHFQTPFGLCESMEQAVGACKSRDMDPELNIRPVVVAEGETRYEVL